MNSPQDTWVIIISTLQHSAAYRIGVFDMSFAGPQQLQANNCDIVSGTLLRKVISNT
jgi:hypothetical protein